MADVASYFVPFDLDTGAGTEDVIGISLRISGSGGSIEAKGQQVAADSIPVVLSSDVNTVDTELPAAVALSADNVVSPTAPAVGAFGLYFDGTNWDRVRGDQTDGLLVNLGTNNDVTVTGAVDTELPTAVALTDNTVNPTVPGVSAFGMVFDGATWDRMLGDSTDGVLVNLGTNNDVTVSGAVDTELPAAAALSDTLANPTAPAVGSHLMGFDRVGVNWTRIDGLIDGQVVNAAAAGFLQFGTDGTNYQALAVDAAGNLQVDVLTGGGSDTPTNPVTNTQTSTAVAVATDTDIDSAAADDKKLAWIDIWASVAWKGEIFTVDNAVESTRKGLCGGPAHTYCKFEPTHRNYITLGNTAGLDAFRVKVRNLDDNNPADFHVVFHYED